MPPIAASDAYQHAVAELDARKRTIYLIGGMAALVVLVASWFGRQPGDVTVAVGYPVIAAILTIHAAAVWRRWLRLQVLELAGYGLLSGVVLARLAWHLHLAGPIDDHLLVLTGGHYWSVGALIIAGFVVFGRRRGLIVGAAVIVASALLVVTGAGPELVGETGSRQALLYLVRVHGFLIIVLALTAAVAAMREQLHRALAHAEMLEELATTDHLTGLANRRSAASLLREHVVAARRYDRPLAVVTVDLDGFKAINDEHGHERGDLVLKEAAAVLASQAREVDTVARWGGEEFLIIMPQTDGPGASALAERCRRLLREAAPGGLKVTATFGVAALSGTDDLRTLLRKADSLLYQGKQAGRDRVMTLETVTTDPIWSDDTDTGRR